MATEQLRLLRDLGRIIGTDAAIGRALGISRQAVGQLRHTAASDTTIARAAALLATDPGAAMARHRADCATDPATAAAWQSVASRLAESRPAIPDPVPKRPPLQPAQSNGRFDNNRPCNTHYAAYSSD